jgi:cobalamin biosynthetic protein CobC
LGNGRDHGGGLDAAIARWGGDRAGWLDLSTGINPVAYPTDGLSKDAWTALPDAGAFERLERAARAFWNVPDEAEILPAAGTSALIARLPQLCETGAVAIERPTYNEHEAAFAASGWTVSGRERANAQVAVHPNNPDGRIWGADEITAPFAVIDESFCDIAPDESLIRLAAQEGRVVLKSFGKFWGLAGLALEIGARALTDTGWATETRLRLQADAVRLDALMQGHGARVVGGTTLFRLYEVDRADDWQVRLAKGHVWSRIFPYSDRWLRLGLPHPDAWDQLEAAL